MSDTIITPDSDPRRDDRAAIALNRQGYGFQSAVAAEVQRLREKCLIPWSVQSAEFPVEVNGHDTRIDLVLGGIEFSAWIIAECKRTNPAMSDWCFFRSALFYRKEGTQVIFEYVYQNPHIENVTSSGRHAFNPIAGQFDVAICARTNLKGDDKAGGEAAIEQSAGQVCIGLNGMVEYLGRTPRAFSNNCRILIPVIFTTAKLYTSQHDLNGTDLHTGDIDASKLKMEEAPYVWYRYRLSPGIKHGQKSEYAYGSLSSVGAVDYTRTIAVVNSGGIERFLRSLDPASLCMDRISGQ